MKNETNAKTSAPKFKDRLKSFWRRYGFDACGWAYICVMLVLMYLPILIIIIYSFNSSKVIGAGNGEFTFANYINLFDNTEILSATVNTIVIALASSALATLIGTISAIGVFYLSKLKAVANFINQITVVNAEIVTAVAFMLFFIFLQSVNIGIPEGYATLIICHTMITVPYVILSVTPRLSQLDPNSYEAGLDLGASPTRSLFTVIVPQLIPGMITGFALAFTLSMDDFIISNFNRGEIHTISTLMYSQMTKRGIDSAFRALSSIMFLAVTVVLIVYNVVKGKRAKKRKFV